MQHNSALARAFELMADLLEIQGENRFRVNSYRRVARTIRDLPRDVSEIAATGELAALPGVGKATVARILEYLEAGCVAEFEAERAKVPPGLPELLSIPGLGPKKVAALWRELSIGSIADLQVALDDGRVEAVAGFGTASAARIAEGIVFLQRSGQRIPCGPAAELADRLTLELRTLPGVSAVAVAGSLRRGLEAIGDIDLLCTAADGAATVQQFTRIDGVQSVLAAGDTKGSVLFPILEREVQVDLRVVPAASHGAALQYFTGSKEHNVRLRERAVRRGWRLNEWGLFDGERCIAGDSEASIYATLDLPWIPPEQREDRGEFERPAAFFDRLVTTEQIRGDLHMHTPASDGRSRLEDLIAAAVVRGYAYINITDHSRSSVVAGGLSVEAMWAHIDAVREVAGRTPGVTVLVGCEVDILTDGTLDYPDDLLAACDIVVGSIHTAQTQDTATITARTLRAIEHPAVDIVGHPTGRLVGKRAASALDIGAVAQAAAATGTALEINASWRRLDLKDRHAEAALAAGALLSINTDAHHVDQLAQMALGVQVARRAGASAEAIINTWPVEEIRAWRARRPKGQLPGTA